MLPLLYVSRLDLTEEGKAPFASWYARRHAPDLVGVGFLSVSSFRAVSGSPEVCNLYELRDVDAFSEDYVSVRAADEEGAQLQPNSSNGRLAVHEQVATAGIEVPAPADGPQWATAVTAPVVGTVLFSAVGMPDAEVIGRGDDELRRCVSQLGATSARLGRQVDAGRPNREVRPWSIFVEWPNVAMARQWAAGVPEAHRSAFGDDEDPLGLHVLRRVFSLVNPDAWT